MRPVVMPVLTMPVLTMPVLTMPVLTMPVLTMPVLTMPVLTMFGVAMLAALHIVFARHDEDAPAQADHLDLRAIEAREDRAGDDLRHAADGRLGTAQIEHAVER